TIMSRLRRGENIEQLETEHLCKDGRRVSLSVTISAMRDADGNVVSASVIGRDISERKRIEQELRDSRGRLAGELANMARLQQLSTRLVPAGDATALLKAIVHAAIEMTSADMGNIQLFNRDSSVLRIVASQGFEPPFLEYFNSVHEGQAACGTAIKTGERVVVEDVTASPLFAGTRELDVLLSAGVRGVQTTPLVGRSGRLVGMLSTHYRVPRRPAEQDIQVLDLLARQGADYMERTYAEEEWRNGESRTKAIMNTVGDAIITVDRSGIIREVNSGAERMFGYASEEMIGQNVTIIMASPYREAHDAYISRYLKSGEKHIIGTSREVDARRKDGSVFPTDLAVEEIKDLKLFVGVHRDLTERKQLEREIVEAASLEQQRIGEDLHDRVGQELTALNMMVRPCGNGAD
ncbi:MAG TPA: PAS domain S-box protein, partial [Planctomycetaceae bacterium]|nr:PAS domain S-box protein [Planctomycetaceae bacterium]